MTGFFKSRSVNDLKKITIILQNTISYMREIQMVDLRNQYLSIKPEIDLAIQSVLDSTSFIKGIQVSSFEKSFGINALSVDRNIG